MFAENHKISVRQLESMILLYFFSTAVLFLPSELADTAGNSCWIVSLLWGVGASLTAVFLVYLGRKHPTYTVVEWYQNSFGKVIGTVFAFGVGGKLIFDGALELRIFCDIISSAMLPRTPLWLLLAAMLILCGLAAAQGAECSARASEILFFVVFIPLVFVLIFVAISTQYNRILPIQIPNGKEIWDSASFSGPFFQGLIALLFVFPYLEKRSHCGRRVWITCMVAIVTIGVLVFLSLAVYGTDALSTKLMPTLQTMERVSFSGIFLGRQDLFLLWIWMVTTFLYLSILLFFGTDLCIRIFQNKERQRNRWLFFWIPLFFIVALLPPDMSAAYWLRVRIAPWTNGVFLLVLPLIALGIDGIKRRCRHA